MARGYRGCGGSNNNSAGGCKVASRPGVAGANRGHMMLIQLLLLTSCQGLSSTLPPKDGDQPPIDMKTVAEAQREAPVVMPSGRAITRECYARETERRKSSNYYPPPSPAPMPATAPRPMRTADKAADGGAVAQGNKAPTGGAPTTTTAPAKVAAAEPMPASPPMPDAAPAEQLKELGYVGGDEGGLTSASTAGKGAPAAERARSEAKKDAQPTSKAKESKPMDTRRLNDAEDEVREMATRPKQALDYGAKIYLSNDDSMSLASAQRLLWAIQNRGAVKSSEIRPHEFLNYFSFDTAPIAPGDLFSVQAAAEQTGDDQLTMAFAVKGATPPRKSLDLSLVLDRSGSMAAEGRMEYLKRGLHTMESQLKRGDRVDLVLFDNEVCTPLENYVVGRDDPSLLTDAINQIQPRGSTDLDSGLREGYRIAAARADANDRNRRMLVITDALLNEGRVNPDIVTEIGKQYESSHIRLSAVGVGREFNDKVLDMLTEKGKGAYVYLGSEAVVDRVFGPMFDSLTHTIAHDVHFGLQLPPSLAMTRFYGEEASTVKEDVKPIHYFANTSQLFLQDVHVRDGNIIPSDPVTLTVEWSDVDTGEAKSQVFTSTVGALVSGDPRNLRKGRTLMAWTDMIQARALGNNPCGQPFATWQDRVQTLGEDAEIGWLDSLTSPLCGSTPAPVVARTSGVEYKVKVDSDQVIAEVQLQCNGNTLSDSLSGSDTVARFANATPGSGCKLVLMGNVPMYASVNVPPTGGETRCTVRGGRLSCG